MKIVFYYFLICAIGTALYFGAVSANSKGKKLTAYLCYFCIFLVALLFI